MWWSVLDPVWIGSSFCASLSNSMSVDSLKLSMMGAFTQKNQKLKQIRAFFFLQRPIQQHIRYMGTLWKNYTLSKTKQTNKKDPKQLTGHPSKKWDLENSLSDSKLPEGWEHVYLYTDYIPRCIPQIYSM